MKIFNCYDSDKGNVCYIVCSDIKKCIEIFEKQFNYCPERIIDITADCKQVFIEE